jgi:NADPH:quinone reductase
LGFLASPPIAPFTSLVPLRATRFWVQGAAGAVGLCAEQLARRAGATVIASVRSSSDEAIASRAGAHHVVRAGDDLVSGVRVLAPDGVDHIVEVAFAANLAKDLEALAIGGSIGTYATDVDTPSIPFWPLLFKNVRVFFLGSDDFPADAKRAATRALNHALASGWEGFEIGERFPLDEIASAHERLESPGRHGRVVMLL